MEMNTKDIKLVCIDSNSYDSRKCWILGRQIFCETLPSLGHTMEEVTYNVRTNTWTAQFPEKLGFADMFLKISVTETGLHILIQTETFGLFATYKKQAIVCLSTFDWRFYSELSDIMKNII